MLKPGDLLVMDNPSAHKDRQALDLQEDAVMKVKLLPAYPPDYHPIELMWRKVKVLLRRAEARCNEALLLAIGDALSRAPQMDATHRLGHCGYGFI